MDDNYRLIGMVSFRNLIDAFLPYELSILKTIPFLEREEIDIFELEITPEMGSLVLVDDLFELHNQLLFQ